MDTKSKKWITAAVIFMLCFIWGHSAVSAEVSKIESAAVGGFLTPFLELFVGPGNVTDHLVRKLAHFAEYAALGFLLGLRTWSGGRTSGHSIYHSLLNAMAAALADESIQLLSDGRGAQVTDILLDTAGAAFGIAAALVICAVVRAKKPGKTDKN